MQQFDNLNDIINALISEIEAQGAEVRITGGSAQSCSVYLDVNGLSVRISDHAPHTQLTVVDYHIGLGTSYGDDMIRVQNVYERLDVDENENVISVECGEMDGDAQHVGYKVDMEELKQAAAAVVAEAK